MSTLSADLIARSTPRLADGVEVVEDPDRGHVRLRGPRFKRGWLRLFLARFFKLSDRIEVELDDVGSWVVTRMDGRADMESIADRLSDHLKLTYREAEAALTVFTRALLRRKLLKIDIDEDRP